MMRTGIETADAGQLEAAQALGFGRARAFWKVTAPQAVCTILPVYRGELISMVKMTSVVGYITIQDLTRMSDIVRGLTMTRSSRSSPPRSSTLPWPTCWA